MKNTPTPRTAARGPTGSEVATGPLPESGRSREATPIPHRIRMRRIFTNVRRPRVLVDTWIRAKWNAAETARTRNATSRVWRSTGATGIGAKLVRATRKIPNPRALIAEAAMCPPHDSQPLTNPLGPGSAARTYSYAPPAPPGRPAASPAYASPARNAPPPARATPVRVSGPAAAYVAPTRTKMAAPTIAPTAAIVTSKRPRSRVTRTRTPSPSSGVATGGHPGRDYLRLWRPQGFAFVADIAISSPREWNAVSTFSPVFAELWKNGASNASVAWRTCSSPNAAWSLRSFLFTANATGISPTVRNTDSIHESRSSRVS